MRANPQQLSRLRPLRALPRDALAALAAAAPLRMLDAHEVLLRAGDHGSLAFLVVSGRLRMRAAGESGRVLGWALPGDLVGERALTENRALRSAMVEAVEASAVLVLDPGALLAPALDPARVALELAALAALRERVRRAGAAVAAAQGEAGRTDGDEGAVFEADTRRLGLLHQLRDAGLRLRRGGA